MSIRLFIFFVSLRFILILLIFAFVPPVLAKSTLRFRNETDRQALLAIKAQIVQDDSHVLGSWNDSTHFCHWQGVSCSLRHQRVRELDLSSLGLIATLSPYVGNLSFLRELILDNNSFYGRIPPQISNLFRVQYISLHNNSFQGDIAINLTNCPGIRFINFGRNNLDGNIPADLGSLSSLVELDLSANNFTGMIPPSLGNLTALQILSLSYNSLEGRIPDELGNLSSLELLQLSSNKLSGELPNELFNITSMKYLSLASNRLSGTFPSSLGFTLANLQIFFVAMNHFHGIIPQSIINMSELRFFDASMNALSGPIPTDMGNLQNLQRLSLDNNELGGSNNETDLSFLASMSSCIGLQILQVGNNHLTGDLPIFSIANLSTNLISLRINDNAISGGLLDGVANLINLQTLDLSGNMLRGRIPDSIGNLNSLQALFLSRNMFSGNIPSSIGSLPRLNVLEMQQNFLEGSLPHSLRNCLRLQNLDLSRNKLTGEIPGEVIDIPSLSFGLNLADNFFSGSLPYEVGRLHNVERLDISNNKFTGEFPNSIVSCTSLLYLNAQSNHFQGTISFINGIGGLEVLDLSSNNFSGPIPGQGGDFRVFQNARYVNLSFNDLEGEVPTVGIFSNSTLFSIIGNKKLCGGLEDLHLLPCTKRSKRRKFVRSPLVWILCSTGLIILFAFILAMRKRTIQEIVRNWSISWTQDTEALLESSIGMQYPNVSYKRLLEATDGFSDAKLIGKGSYGTVYEGHFNEKAVAVKVFNLERRGARKSFMAECEAMRNIRHRNIIKVITSCSASDLKGNDFKALVYELMPNGSLESWLHPGSSPLLQPKKLSLIQSLNICIDVASALHYLHHCCEMPVVHRDIKPSNILLDKDLCAHLGDFGSAVSLLVPIEDATGFRIRSSSIAIVGTIGYIALENAMGARTSTSLDVYSYGILLLELFTGKRPTSSMFSGDFSLHNYVKMSLPDQAMDVVDPLLLFEAESDSRRRTNTVDNIKTCLASVLGLGVRCSAQLPRERLKMTDALMEINSIREMCF